MSPRRTLRAGDLVEVRPAEEILETLDARGRLDALPFMPEMLRYCGRRFRVRARADKTCDTIGRPISLRMERAVHLDDLRCDGSAHGGCQARCLLFWKEEWLRRVPAARGPEAAAHEAAPPGTGSGEGPAEGVARLEDAARVPPAPPEEPEERFVCQATELQRATTPMRWWEPGQYLRELWTRNVSLVDFTRTVARAAFNYVQKRRDGLPRPFVHGTLDGPTPTARLDLEVGELVRIKSQAEIQATLDRAQKNRGLYFDVEMVPYCGRTVRVKERVERIVDEKTGRMLHFGSDCIMLEGVTCGGCLSHDRLFCPRAIHSFWREIWLERVGPDDGAPSTGEATA